MNRERIIEFLGEDWTGTMNIIRTVLSSDIALLEDLNGGILSRSGKQLRPMVSLLSAKLCSGGPLNEGSRRFAAAAELLHNATLMHDDVADESQERRGMPTLAALIGPSAAVLVGDYWLSKAVQTVMSVPDHEKAVGIFSKTLCDLSEGEMLQLQNAESASTGREDYLRVIYCKTASLFEASCVAGAYSVGAPSEKVEAVRLYAKALGCAFQIKDDILDYSGDERLGKPVGADLKERKITLPLLGAIANAPEREEEIRGMVRDIPSSPGNCETLRRFVLDNGGVGYASEELDRFISEAVSSLEIFENSPQKDYLVQIARFNAFRRL